MSDRSKSPDDLIRSSSVYREFLAEREEILRHKWLESEKAGHDIGFERALLDWIKKHRDGWRDARRTERPRCTREVESGRARGGPESS